MPLISTKLALKLGVSLLSSSSKEGMEKRVIALIGTLIAIPIIFLVALFSSGSTSDERDHYEIAFDRLGCGSEYNYQIEDIRFFDSYTLPENAENPLSIEVIQNRMEQDYFFIKSSSSTSKLPGIGSTTTSNVCLLKSDEVIYETLVDKYNVDKDLKEEILESIQQLRNGRANFSRPIAGSIIQDYDTKKEASGIAFKAENNQTSVTAISSGTVIEIKTENDTYIVDEEEYKKGLTVLLEHDVIRGLKRDGEYDTIKMYSYYTNLSNVSLSVGDEVEQDQEIGKTSKKQMYFEIRDKDGKTINPNDYIFFSTGKFSMPFDEPFTLTSGMGERDLGYHYGNDFAKEYGAAIHSITDGEVIEINTTCNPNPDSPSICPTTGNVQRGGNYVVIKCVIEGTTYYIHYAHMKQVSASVGQKIYAGQIIGFQGNSGNSYGSHVHIEAHTGGINTADKDSAFDVNEWLQIPSQEEER